MGKVFLGKLVTPDNWKEFMPPLDVDPAEVTTAEYRKALNRQRWRAKQERNREQKHLKAFLAGKEWYKDGYSTEEINGVEVKTPNIYKVLYREDAD